MTGPDSSNPAPLASTDLFTDLSTELLRQGKSIRFRATGRSMYPTIREGEAITVEPITPSSVRTGDIVLYRSAGQHVAHRVTRVEREGGRSVRFVLRDDTSGIRDETVTSEQILGKVVAAERGGRTVNPYSVRSKLRRIVHSMASGIKRLSL